MPCIVDILDKIKSIHACPAESGVILSEIFVTVHGSKVSRLKRDSKVVFLSP